MPFLDRSDLQSALHKYEETIGFIDYIISENTDAKFIVLGDFNCNIYDNSHPFAAPLNDFLTSRNLVSTFSRMASFNAHS